MSDYPPPPPPPSPGPQYGGTPDHGQVYPGQPHPVDPYAGQPYAGGGQPPGGVPPAPSTGGGGRFDDAFRGRLARRPEPRFTAALAGVGAGLALFGALVWGFTYYLDGLFNSFDGNGGFGNTDRNLLGAGLAALLVVAGYVLAVSQRRGALATAGVVLIGIGLPIAIGFLTLDATSGTNSDAVFWVSVIVWAATYLFVPGAKGHTFFVFLVAAGLLNYLIAKNTNNVSTDVVFGAGPHFPASGTIAAIGLVLGVIYYAIAFGLDRTGRHGAATGLVFPAFAATALGIIAWSPDIHRAGAGVLAVIVGLVICWYGGRYGRRATCFAAAAGVAAGVVAIVADAVGDNNTGTAAGVSFLLVGVAIMIVAGVLNRTLDEPDDMDAEAVVASR